MHKTLDEVNITPKHDFTPEPPKEQVKKDIEINSIKVKINELIAESTQKNSFKILELTDKLMSLNKDECYKFFGGWYEYHKNIGILKEFRRQFYPTKIEKIFSSIVLLLASIPLTLFGYIATFTPIKEIHFMLIFFYLIFGGTLIIGISMFLSSIHTIYKTILE